MTPTKKAAADSLIAWHFEVEHELLAVYRFVSDNEDAADEPIKLLEINPATPASGRVEAFAFPPADGMPYRTVVAEITPAEFERLKRDELKLPAGWSLARAECTTRTQT